MAKILTTWRMETVWTEEMDEEYAKAVEWYEMPYYDDIREYKKELKRECKEKLAQIREDIENGVIL